MKTLLHFSILVLIVTSCGCDSRVSPDTALPDTALPTTDAPDAVPVEEIESAELTISDEQAAEFSSRWLQAVAGNNVAAVRSLVDWAGITRRALQGFDVNAEFQRDFITRSTSPEMIQDLIGNIAKDINEGGSYRLVRVTRRDGRPHITLRLLSANGALNYHDLRLTRAGQNIFADQLFFASSGESFGDTMRSSFGREVQSETSSISRLSDEMQREVASLQRQSEMATAVRQGHREEALAVYEKMTHEMQQRKMPMMFRIMATDIGDGQAYLKAVHDFDAKYRDDASVGLITLDAAIFSENHVLLMKSYDQLQRFTGGDPYLNLMVGGVLANQGKLAEAKRLTDPIDAAPLQLPSAHDFKLSVAMAAKDHPATLKQLLALRDSFGFDLTDLTGVEGFEGFVESPQYQQWQESANEPAGGE